MAARAFLLAVGTLLGGTGPIWCSPISQSRILKPTQCEESDFHGDLGKPPYQYGVAIRKGFVAGPHPTVGATLMKSIEVALVRTVPCEVLALPGGDDLQITYQFLRGGKSPLLLVAYHWVTLEEEPDAGNAEEPGEDAESGTEDIIPSQYWYDLIRISRDRSGLVLRTVWESGNDSVRLRPQRAVPVAFSPFPPPAAGLVLFAEWNEFSYAADDGGRGYAHQFEALFPVDLSGRIALSEAADSKPAIPRPFLARWSGYHFNIYSDALGHPVVTDFILRSDIPISVSTWNETLRRFEKREEPLPPDLRSAPFDPKGNHDPHRIGEAVGDLIGKPLIFRNSILVDGIDFELGNEDTERRPDLEAAKSRLPPIHKPVDRGLGRFLSEKWGYEVDMPQGPHLWEGQDGGSIAVGRWTEAGSCLAWSGGMEFRVEAALIEPKSLEFRIGLLRKDLEVRAKVFGGKLSSMTETTVFGHRAVAYRISYSIKGNARLIRGRQLILGNRLYVVQTDEPAGGGAPEDRVAPDRERFFRSFALKGDPGTR